MLPGLPRTGHDRQPASFTHHQCFQPFLCPGEDITGQGCMSGTGVQSEYEGKPN